MLPAKDQDLTDRFRGLFAKITDSLLQRRDHDPPKRAYITNLEKDSEFRICNPLGNELMYHIDALHIQIQAEMMMMKPSAFGYSAPRRWRTRLVDQQKLAKNFVLGPKGFNDDQGYLPLHAVKDALYCKTGVSSHDFLSELMRFGMIKGAQFKYREWFDEFGSIKLKSEDSISSHRKRNRAPRVSSQRDHNGNDINHNMDSESNAISQDNDIDLSDNVDLSPLVESYGKISSLKL